MLFNRSEETDEVSQEYDRCRMRSYWCEAGRCPVPQTVSCYLEKRGEELDMKCFPYVMLMTLIK